MIEERQFELGFMGCDFYKNKIKVIKYFICNLSPAMSKESTSLILSMTVRDTLQLFYFFYFS